MILKPQKWQNSALKIKDLQRRKMAVGNFLTAPPEK